jgi:hypothetical protein
MSKAQMAFRLGYLPHYLTQSQGLFWASKSPENEWGSSANVKLCLDRMHEAVLGLADEIHVTIYGELRNDLQLQRVRWNAIDGIMADCHRNDRPMDLSDVRSLPDPAPDLAPLTGNVIPAFHNPLKQAGWLCSACTAQACSVPDLRPSPLPHSRMLPGASPPAPEEPFPRQRNLPLDRDDFPGVLGGEPGDRLVHIDLLQIGTRVLR